MKKSLIMMSAIACLSVHAMDPVAAPRPTISRVEPCRNGNGATISYANGEKKEVNLDSNAGAILSRHFNGVWSHIVEVLEMT
ncbi:MAG: hypothetical protein LBF54_01335 [Holosporaceae bacterium]|jgi:hypothetical protein|nr:hypothetical protein [Holosporaceae bacterium]